jgi:excisionase family DNA binding protein
MGGNMAQRAFNIEDSKMKNGGLMDVREVAEFLGLAVGTVYHLVSQKRIPFVRLSSRCLRFRPSQIEAWIQQKSNKGETK